MKICWKNLMLLYFNVKDLDNSLNAGYALMEDQGDGQYKMILGKGALYDVAARTGETLKLKESNKTQLYQVAGATVGKQNVYAIVKPLSLYSNNVPYEDTNWCLCGLITEKSIYGLGNSVYKIILAAIVGSTILAAFCVYFLVTYVTKPVNRLVEGVRGGVEGIHAFTPADIAEIDELHDVIENLTDAQQQAEEQLLKRLEEVCTIIQNRMNLERHDLSAQAKSEFLARMSHEIRTPMNGIIGMTEIALQNEQTEEKRIDCLKKIQSSSGYLLNILNDILDMSKIESGKMQLVYGRYNLKKLLDNVETLMESRMSERQISFTKQINLIHEWFYCDELRINQVLLNLLSNAVKYTHKGGNVCLTVKEICDEKEKASLYFSVQDDGIGIEKEKQKLIFQNFEQADESEIARRQGTGLGLAISRRLIHMMDSEINLESELHKGSNFSFTLKLKYLESVEEVKDSSEKSLDLKGKHILIVEDNELNMEIIHTILDEYKAKIVEAYDGQQALERIRQSKEGEYDLILMDIMMPVMDGLEAAREIRKLPRDDCKTLPIVAMSANAFDEDVKKSLASGMDAHLSKPINMEQLEKTLVRFVKGPC